MNIIKKNWSIIIIVILLGVIWYLYTSPKKEVVETQKTPTQTTVKTPELSEKIKNETIKETYTGQTINVTYPTLNSTEATKAIKKYIDEEISIFKENTDWGVDTGISPVENSDLFLTIDYREEKSSHIHTYVFIEETYTGGAHPLHMSKTFSVSRSGKVLSVTDLFTNEKDGLFTIAPFVQKELSSRGIGDASQIKEGAAPTVENYQNFIPTDTSLTIIFDPYQVAAYAAGTQIVEIPLSKFKGIANPDVFTVQ